MKSISIKAKFLASFGIKLVLACAVGIFSIIELSAMTDLNRHLNSDVLLGVAVSNSLDAELSTRMLSTAKAARATKASARSHPPGC